MLIGESSAIEERRISPRLRRLGRMKGAIRKKHESNTDVSYSKQVNLKSSFSNWRLHA